MLGIDPVEFVRYDTGNGTRSGNLHLSALLHLQSGQPADVDTYHSAILQEIERQQLAGKGILYQTLFRFSSSAD